MKILVLGHKGMLGHMVCKFFSQYNFEIKTIESKWPNQDFCNSIKQSDCDILINCIGSIPQKIKNNNYDLFSCNFLLPIFLSEHFSGKIIHPSTDCEFSGNSKKLYSKNDIRDATDYYGISKKYAGEYLETKNNIHIIRTSIIGPEINNKCSLLEWLLNNNDDKINGFSNHFWNGITTLQWCKICLSVIDESLTDKLIQIGTDPISKFDLLNIINEIFELNKKIINFSNGNLIYKCLQSDLNVPSIKDQIFELKNWYYI
jgi:dTDP-4-dehydrorhamnose reductase